MFSNEIKEYNHISLLEDVHRIYEPVIESASLWEVILEFFALCEGLCAAYGARGVYANEIDIHER